ncbi:MAG: translation initiation factor IF-3 [Candidatus Levybacteria bacterium RIFCSPHIGHO2_02_FULL_40_18]|nr:MAG: translation initiation factor IF-3 [Candidatus Levybacteria bacterium RIFCSPHIGHO2_01_FULL_40_58]OGH26816.1 MAG: translation initiation factor IF-3 [Candidatus Levybacteria bacterium RIFCSPHIGHO2_02_FULL_40_18]OGH31751.1 MAG: translation initiation factor IF-3 [Candidatus Levybacteria bacterium RIFCSPHIGHO2_12_FULL_40_31]OGH40651.1 MAG: translation initiation factor IF-3 [Candidatus Levybacteria bacterium RIFCSPLOWO2_01_FULL_40_64]OGH48823.1 MAG: translation initiation factor IF-3 [Cand
MRRHYKFKREVRYRINREIASPTVRLLDDTGKQIGVLPIAEARALSEEKVLDLVELAPQARPPVVKLIDYNKFLYQLKKKKQEEKKHAKPSETKQVQFGPFIDDHDLEIKLSRAREFIKEGDKVRVVVKFRGREMTKQYLGREVLGRVIDRMQDIAKVEKDMHMEGRQLVMVMSKGAKNEAQTKENGSGKMEISN